MPKFKVDAKSSLSPDETFQKIKTMLESDKDLRKLDNYVCQFDETKRTGTAKGAKFEASMNVLAQTSGSTVAIEVSLPMLLTPLKGIVQSTLEKKLGALLG